MSRYTVGYKGLQALK